MDKREAGGREQGKKSSAREKVPSGDLTFRESARAEGTRPPWESQP